MGLGGGERLTEIRFRQSSGQRACSDSEADAPLPWSFEIDIHSVADGVFELGMFR